MDKNLKLIAFVVGGLIFGFWIVTRGLDWYQSRQNKTTANNSTSGNVAFGDTTYDQLHF